MKRKTIAIPVCVLLFCMMFSGCISVNKTMQNDKDSGYTVYSKDDSTAIVFVSSMNYGNTTVIVDTIDSMYDNGFRYVCMVPIPDNNYNSNNKFYLVFRKGI